MDATMMQCLARRHAALEARYRAIKDGKLPLWRLIWEVLRPNRTRYASRRRLRKAQLQQARAS
jgi:hypothetical protein